MKPKMTSVDTQNAKLEFKYSKDVGKLYKWGICAENREEMKKMFMEVKGK